MPPEIIIAAIGVIASLGAAIVASRAQARTSAASLYTNLCADLLKERADLVERLNSNEAEIRKLQCALIEAQTAIAEIKGEKERLAARVTELERENTDLKAQIEALQRKRSTRATA